MNKQPLKHRRRGMAVVMILGLLAITMAMSYSMMRSQAINAQIQHNSQRGGHARQAAITGLATALRRIHQDDWEGIDSKLTGWLSTTESYSVSFATGDAALTPTDPDYEMYPYRVTITSVGRVEDLYDSTIFAEHTQQAVVQLVPRKLAETPPDWASIQQHTIYQWANHHVDIDIPVRIEGPIYLQGEFNFCEFIPDSASGFDGAIDEVAFFKEALASDEISKFHGSALGTDTTYAGLVDAYSSKNPINWWRLNESGGATANDQATNNNDGTYNATTLGATGPPVVDPSNAVDFHGAESFVDLGTMDVHDNSSAIDKFSMLAWFKPDALVNDEVPIVCKTNGLADADHIWTLSIVKTGASHFLRFRLSTDAGNKILTASAGTISVDQWHFAAATYDGTKMRLYLDGVEVENKNHSDYIVMDSSVPAMIGGSFDANNPRQRYLQDLMAMLTAGMDDNRPFDGPIDLPTSLSSANTLSYLQNDLNVTVNDVPSAGTDPLTYSGTPTTYQLYPGGAVYTVPTLASSLSNTTLEPDPLTNPLGIYARTAGLTINDNVTIRGTLLIGNTIHIHGDNVNIQPYNLPPLEGTSQPVQLPVMIAGNNMHIENISEVTVQGMATVYDKFEIKQSNQDATILNWQGRIVCKRLTVRQRNEWNHSSDWWHDRLDEFLIQLNGPSPILYFPEWLEVNYGLQPEPVLTIKPESSAVTYHWQDWNLPIFVPHDNDDGLRWDVIRWKDNP